VAAGMGVAILNGLALHAHRAPASRAHPPRCHGPRSAAIPAWAAK
jgi:hypothetical protein